MAASSSIAAPSVAASPARGAARRMPLHAVGSSGSAPWKISSNSFSPGRRPLTLISMSILGRLPARRIIWRARAMMRTGSPMSRTKSLPAASPWLPRTEACRTSSTASRTVMKERITSGSVPVNGPPAARLGHGAVEAGGVAHVGEDGAARQVGMRIGDFEIDAVEVELAAVEQGDLGRAEAAYLGHQLAADRAAGAGHQDAAAGDQPADGGAAAAGLL